MRGLDTFNVIELGWNDRIAMGGYTVKFAKVKKLNHFSLNIYLCYTSVWCDDKALNIAMI